MLKLSRESIYTMFNKNYQEKLSETPQATITATRKILRPLVYLLLKFRIIFPQLAEILKKVYVEVAEDKFRLPDKELTESRISLLTGIHRKDVKRLRANARTDKTTPAKVDIGARMVARWISDPAYLDENDHPKVLPLKAKNKMTPSFEKLVYDICKQDIRPRVVLDDWLNLGIITLREDMVSLNTQAFIAKNGDDEKAFFLGHNIADHLSAATSNLVDDDAPSFFERCIYYDGLSEDSIKQLEQMVQEKGMETIVAINKLAMQLKKRDSNPQLSENNKRINIGLYVYHEEEQND